METCFILIFIFPNVASLTMPVVILDPYATLKPGYVSGNPFHKATSNTFAELVQDAVHSTDSILIFVEETFSVEDISRRDEQGNAYKYLHQSFLEEKAKYMPSVDDPFRTLQRLLPPAESNVVYLSDSTELKNNFQYLYLYFGRSSNKNRVETMRTHDELIKKVYNNLAQTRKGPIIAFYTGKNNPMLGLSRTGYQKPQSQAAIDSIMRVDNKALIRLSGVVLQHGSTRSVQRAPAASAQAFARTRLSTRMLYDEFELDFNFEYLRDSWLLDSVVLLEGDEEVGRTSMGVGAPYDWSYYCSEPLMIVNTRDRSYVTISRYQVEPLRASADTLPVYKADTREEDAKDKTDENNKKEENEKKETATPDKNSFTNTVNCGTNFNCRILSGLLVVAIMLSITMYGIIMLFNCQSNDRMDDPNQKPLVIVAQL